eukprot:m.245869 g.245869  ORF g.245869 m.245869 type:complete len:614 (+) comp54470_c0_seq38:2467-4308(+)
MSGYDSFMDLRDGSDTTDFEDIISVASSGFSDEQQLFLYGFYERSEASTPSDTGLIGFHNRSIASASEDGSEVAEINDVSETASLLNSMQPLSGSSLSLTRHDNTIPETEPGEDSISSATPNATTVPSTLSPLLPLAAAHSVHQPAALLGLRGRRGSNRGSQAASFGPLGSGGPSRSSKHIGQCFVCSETSSLHKYFNSSQRNQCKNCQGYFVYEVNKCYQANEDPQEVATRRTKWRLQRCLQAGMDPSAVNVKIQPVKQSTTRPSVRRVKDQLCNILDIREHTAIGENLDTLQHVSPKLFITFPNHESLSPSNERCEWGTIAFYPPVPVSLLDQLREGKQIAARVSCTAQSPNHDESVTLIYYQAVHENLLYEACPAFSALTEFAATQPKASILLPLRPLLCKSGPSISEPDARRLVATWLDFLQAIIQPGLHSTVPAIDTEELLLFQGVLATTPAIQSSTGFSVLHIAAIMNWKALVQDVLARLSLWQASGIVPDFSALVQALHPGCRDKRAWTPMVWAEVCNSSATAHALAPYYPDARADQESLTDVSAKQEDPPLSSGTTEGARVDDTFGFFSASLQDTMAPQASDLFEETSKLDRERRHVRFHPDDLE